MIKPGLKMYKFTWKNMMKFLKTGAPQNLEHPVKYVEPLIPVRPPVRLRQFFLSS